MTAPVVDLDAVARLVREVGLELVLPRFRDLRAGEISEKSPGDLVTAVDVEAERVLTARLGEIAPGVPVVGEEAVAADAALLDVLAREPLAFVVDPIDGTRAFVEGDPDFAVMVALVERGVTVASWISLPAYDELFTAVLGEGVWVSRGTGEPERLRTDARPER
ncbi:MAG: inositol monophosphatase, partial [Actinomycetota bacterium]|nr:inositol monophosphatase [Actinomycetota bacterium]